MSIKTQKKIISFTKIIKRWYSERILLRKTL
jgi:hypothetical protein